MPVYLSSEQLLRFASVLQSMQIVIVKGITFYSILTSPFADYRIQGLN